MEQTFPDRPLTTVLLAQWEKGSTVAERMCADILKLDGYAGIDPQCPLGGPDGGKDILCEKDGLAFVAACHFAVGDIAYTATRKKFDDDLDASLKHQRDAFIFLTNQKLTPGERKELEGRAAQKGKRCILYTREHLRLTLDSAAGYGLRLQHLGVEMTIEEQTAYFRHRAKASPLPSPSRRTRSIDWPSMSIVAARDIATSRFKRSPSRCRHTRPAP